MKKAVDVVLVLCAIIVTGLSVWRALPSDSLTSVKVRDKAAVEETPRYHGKLSAKYRVVVFTDYECPACKRFDREADSLVQANGDSVLVVFRHFPVESSHPRALPAAKVAECAAAQGRFTEVHHALFRLDLAKSDDWQGELLESIPAIDRRRLEACLSGPETLRRIQVDQALGQRLGLTGTPSVIIRNKLYTGGMPRAQVEALLFAR